MNRIQLRLKPALRYQAITAGKAYLVFLTVMVGVLLALRILGAILIINGQETNIHFNGIGMASLIMTFVMGLVSIREDFKMLLQNGFGRVTIWLGNVLISLGLAIGLAILSELLLLVGNLFNTAGMRIEDIISIFTPHGDIQTLPLLSSIGIRVALYFLLWQIGLVISLIYYRLSKFGKVIFSVVALTLLTVGLPMLASRLPGLFSRLSSLLSAMFSSLPGLICYPLLGALICAGLAWLLLRKAQVVES